MLKSPVRVALCAALLVLVAACNKNPAESSAPAAMVASSTAPDAAILASAALVKRGDIEGLMQNSMPAADFAKMKADWATEKNEKPITDEDRQKFAATMAKLTAPNAAETLYTEIQPKLAEFDAKYQMQVPVYVAMGSSWLQGMVNQDKDMSAADKQQANAAIGAIGAWAQKTRFTDPVLVKKVLAIATETAGKLNLKTLDEARALNFEQTMQKAQIAFQGIKQALAVYDFSIDKLMDSVKPEVLSNDGKAAKVKVAYTLFDTPLTIDTEMVNVDGHWYGKKAIEKMKEKTAQEATTAPPAATTAPAATPVSPPPAPAH
jgi:hypothetical protein